MWVTFVSHNLLVTICDCKWYCLARYVWRGPVYRRFTNKTVSIREIQILKSSKEFKNRLNCTNRVRHCWSRPGDSNLQFRESNDWTNLFSDSCLAYCISFLSRIYPEYYLVSHKLWVVWNSNFLNHFHRLNVCIMIQTMIQSMSDDTAMLADYKKQNGEPFG